MGRVPDQDRVGSVVAGKYRIDRVIASGGMGTVYAASHEQTSKSVAIKILHDEYAGRENIIRRFEREARASGQLAHPNVVDVIDVGRSEDGTVFLIMELIEGQTLFELLRKEKRLSVERTLRILLPVMDALHKAHQNKIVHRDLKPENVMIREDGAELRSTLLDFGIAKLLDSNRTQLTMKGALIGTAQYMSPEQLIDTTNVGPKADIWAMGVLIYQCLSGSLPYDGPHPAAISGVVLEAAPPSVLLRFTDVPKPIAKVLDRALVRDQKERYPDMACLAAGLLKAVEDMDVDIEDVRHPATPMALAHVESMGPRIIEVKETLPYAPAVPADPITTPTRSSFPTLPGKDQPVQRMAVLTGLGLSLLGALAVAFALALFLWHHRSGAGASAEEIQNQAAAPAAEPASAVTAVGAPIPEDEPEEAEAHQEPLRAVQLPLEESETTPAPEPQTRRERRRARRERPEPEPEVEPEPEPEPEPEYSGELVPF